MHIKDTNLEGCSMQNALQGQIQPKLHFSFSLIFLEGVFKLVGGDSMGFDMKMWHLILNSLTTFLKLTGMSGMVPDKACCPLQAD